MNSEEPSNNGALSANLMLENLASEAEAEDSADFESGNAGEPSNGGVESKGADSTIEAARSIVGGAAWAVSQRYGVRYPEELIEEGAQVLAPCLVGESEPPAWFVSMFGEHLHYIKAGAFFGSVAFNTYVSIQASKHSDKESVEGASQPTE